VGGEREKKKEEAERRGGGVQSIMAKGRERSNNGEWKGGGLIDQRGRGVFWLANNGERYTLGRGGGRGGAMM
jgi:hypothetical protein